MAKRSCRRTAEENVIHYKAVKLRKMTDEQLVSYMDSIKKSVNISEYIGPFINSLESENISGVGQATISKIRAYANKYMEDF
ncbi:MAG: hypothetical protein Q4D26_10490 [Clostridia bacterium]|nr:hypothetical protein [Clostridia bacterium]